jgi:uncharacterized protein with von Willebrand factor type A (vWA) domain
MQNSEIVPAYQAFFDNMFINEDEIELAARYEIEDTVDTLVVYEEHVKEKLVEFQGAIIDYLTKKYPAKAANIISKTAYDMLRYNVDKYKLLVFPLSCKVKNKSSTCCNNRHHKRYNRSKKIIELLPHDEYNDLYDVKAMSSQITIQNAYIRQLLKDGNEKDDLVNKLSKRVKHLEGLLDNKMYSNVSGSGSGSILGKKERRTRNQCRAQAKYKKQAEKDRKASKEIAAAAAASVAGAAAYIAAAKAAEEKEGEEEMPEEEEIFTPPIPPTPAAVNPDDMGNLGILKPAGSFQLCQIPLTYDQCKESMINYREHKCTRDCELQRTQNRELIDQFWEQNRLSYEDYYHKFGAYFEIVRSRPDYIPPTDEDCMYTQVLKHGIFKLK